ESVLFEMRGRGDIVRTARKIAAHARANGFRLLHSHTVRTAVVGASASLMARIPLVHHVHSPTTRDTHRRMNDAINGLAERLVLRRAPALVPVSASLARELKSAFPTARIAPIPNGVSVVEPMANPGQRTEITLAMVALFRQRKGIEVLLRALKQ